MAGLSDFLLKYVSIFKGRYSVMWQWLGAEAVVVLYRYFNLCRVECGHLAISSDRLFSRLGVLFVRMHNFSDRQVSHFLDPVLYS